MTGRYMGGAVAVATLVVAGACAAPASQSAITASASAQLSAQVAALSAAAVAGDRSGAEIRLGQLLASVHTLETAHQLSAARAGQILSTAAEVEAQLATLPTPAPTTTSTTTTTTIVTTPLAPPHHGKGKGGDG